MPLARRGLLGFDYAPSIDNGTLARVRTTCPGINTPELDFYGNSILKAEAKEINDHWLRDEENAKKFLKILRDSIIEYEVDNRIDSLSEGMKDRIRCKKDGVISYVHKRHRALHRIDSLVLHQTAGPERPLSKYYDFSVHFVISPKGKIYQIHDESVYCYGSSKLNKRSVAVEFVGHFKQDNGKWNKSNNLRNVPTKQQIEAGRKLVTYLKKTLGIKYVLAHAQAAKKNCPGPEIWFNVGEWAIKKGLSADGRNISHAPGGRVPQEWRDEKYDIKNFLLAPSF